MKSDVNSQMTNIQKVLLAPGGKRALMNAYFKADGPSQRHKLISWLKILAPGNWAIHLRFAGAKRHLKQHNMAFRSAQRSLLLNPQSVDGEKFMVLGFDGVWWRFENVRRLASHLYRFKTLAPKSVIATWVAARLW